jgi:hypothetical protein
MPLDIDLFILLMFSLFEAWFKGVVLLDLLAVAKFIQRYSMFVVLASLEIIICLSLFLDYFPITPPRILSFYVFYLK